MSRKTKKKRGAAAPPVPPRRPLFRRGAAVLAACLLLLGAAFAATRIPAVRRAVGMRPLLAPAAAPPQQGPLPLAKEYIYAGGRMVATEEPLARPFPNGVPHAIPGTVQAEDFDRGGEGVAYHDLDTHSSPEHRPGERVWVENCSNPDGGCNVGSTWGGEWLEYTVAVAAAGPYTFEARVASGNGGGATFRLDLDGAPVTGALTVPGTGGWQSYQTVSASVTLPAGVHALRLTVLSNGPNGGGGNYNYLRFTSGAAGPAPTNLVATATATTSVRLTWAAPAGNVTGYKVERRQAGAGFAEVAEVPAGTLEYEDGGRSPNASYLYQVRAVFTGGGLSAYSNRDIATTVLFEDDPLATGVAVRYRHVEQLRAAVEAVWALAGQPGAPDWSGAPQAQQHGPIYAWHVRRLREQLDPALAALGLPQVGGDPTLAAGQPMRKEHVQGVRDKLK